MSTRLALPNRRDQITQRLRIVGQRTLYISVNDDKYPTEIFIREDIDPLIKSPYDASPQNTKQEQSSAKEENS